MYKDINITVWKPDKISKLYQRWSWHKIIEAGEVSTEFTAGWYYKLGKTEFGVYNSKRDAEASMLLRLKDYSWQE